MSAVAVGPVVVVLLLRLVMLCTGLMAGCCLRWD